MYSTDSEDTSNMSEDDRPPKLNLKPLAPLAIVGLIDAISFMIVTPSLVFYVLQVGGSKEQYGIILSMFSLAAFLFKPVLGFWSDVSGKFRLPYLSSLVIGMVGSSLYFMANAFHGNVAIALILVGRLLSGCGGANNTLAFTYIALVVPSENLTKANAILSMVRVLGMAIAPVLNALLHRADASLQIGLHSVKIDPLNSVGLVLLFGNAFAFAVIYFMLKEPSEESVVAKKAGDVLVHADSERESLFRNIFRSDIIVPILSIFVLNANFQLLETGLAPAANDVLGWQPPAISALFGLNAFIIFFAILLTFQLSSMGYKDLTMIKFGELSSIIGYFLMFLFWKRGVSVGLFALPVVLSCVGFPFLGAPTRSLFTVAVSRNDYLRRRQGSMQAILSMSASVAGFASPGLIAAFVLRTPDEVDASRDQRELTAWALFAPVFATAILAGIYYIQFNYPEEARQAEEVDADWQVDERLGLLGAAKESYGHFQPRTEAARRHSVTLMQIPQFSFHHDPPPKVERHSVYF